MRVLKDTVRPGLARIKRELEALKGMSGHILALIHISEPTRQAEITYGVFCL